MPQGMVVAPQQVAALRQLAQLAHPQQQLLAMMNPMVLSSLTSRALLLHTLLGGGVQAVQQQQTSMEQQHLVHSTNVQVGGGERANFGQSQSRMLDFGEFGQFMEPFLAVLGISQLESYINFTVNDP